MLALRLCLLSAAFFLGGCAVFSRTPAKATKPENDPSWVERLEERREPSKIEAQLETLRTELAAEKVRNGILKAEKKRRQSSGSWEDELGPMPEVRASKKERALPTVRLKPFPASRARVLDDEEQDAEMAAASEDEQTVVDSSHEELHRYFEGVERLKNGQIDRALIAFRDFLEQSPDHVYADRALAHIAEAHEVAGEWTSVIQATNRLESGYRYSFLMPEALYRRAAAYAALKETAKAQETWRALLRRYPNEPEADRASRRLAEIGGTLPSLAPKQAPGVTARNGTQGSARARRPPLLLRDIPKK